jgi:hypothetical protein
MKPAMNSRPFLILSRAFFFLGVAMGLILSVIAIWNDLESTSYFFTGVEHDPFNGLRCPVMIAPSERGTVTAVFNNSTDQEDNFYYRVEISGRSFSTRQIEDHIAVPPHQAKNIRLTVDAQDIDLLFFIFTKMTILPNSVRSTQESTCGIMVTNILGLTGPQTSTAAVFLSFTAIAAGLGLWPQTSEKAERGSRYIVPTLGFVVLFTLLVASMGWYAISIVLTIVIILLMLISMRFAWV